MAWQGNDEYTKFILCFLFNVHHCYSILELKNQKSYHGELKSKYRNKYTLQCLGVKGKVENIEKYARENKVTNPIF
jgi:hypothetical protein